MKRLPKRRVLTAREKLMRKRYTRLVKCPHNGMYWVFLSVEVQSFKCGGEFDKRFEVVWFRDMLAIALAKIEL